MTMPSTERLIANGQFKRLPARGAEVLPAARRLLMSRDWRARCNALRILDHVPGDEDADRMVELLDDPHPEVRKWAAHALGCDRCKGDVPRATNPSPALMRLAAEDPDVAVRRSATVCLAWNRPIERRVGLFLSSLAEATTDPKIELHARHGRDRHLGRRDSA